MLKQWMYGATLSVALMTMTACSSNKPQTLGVMGVEPVSIQSRTAGTAEQLTEPAAYLINDAITLENIGAKALTDIVVDFDTQSLVVFALGECTTGGYWAHIDGVQQLGDSIIIQGTANKPADGATQAITYPFEAVVVSKVRGTPVLDVTSVEGQDHPSDEVMVEEVKAEEPAAAEAKAQAPAEVPAEEAVQDAAK